MTFRNASVAIALAAMLAAGAWLLMFERDGGERVRFAVYRPGAAQFFLDSAVAPGRSLDYVHDKSEVVSFGVPGEIGLACPQSDPADPRGFRTFAGGVWHLRAGDVGLGQAGDLPLCADFDGDGSADIGVFRDGMWYVATRRDGGPPDLRFAFGASGDRPVVLNVKGAGNATDRKSVVYGVYRRGMWYLDTRGTGKVEAAHAFGGLPQDVPLLIPRWSREPGAGPAYSLAIFRDGTWHIKPDPDGTQTLAFSFGAPGDLPGFVH